VEQIVGVLRQSKVDVAFAELILKAGIGEWRFHFQKAKI
jgi:hypothetical protein